MSKVYSQSEIDLIKWLSENHLISKGLKIGPDEIDLEKYIELNKAELLKNGILGMPKEATTDTKLDNILLNLKAAFVLFDDLREKIPIDPNEAIDTLNLIEDSFSMVIKNLTAYLNKLD